VLKPNDPVIFRAIRTGIGEALRSQLVTLGNPPEKLLDLLQALDCPELMMRGNAETRAREARTVKL
jgi:hypothetical protein